jgi:glutamine synthetase
MDEQREVNTGCTEKGMQTCDRTVTHRWTIKKDKMKE